jgi:hypothetical protein
MQATRIYGVNKYIPKTPFNKPQNCASTAHLIVHDPTATDNLELPTTHKLGEVLLLLPRGVAPPPLQVRHLLPYELPARILHDETKNRYQDETRSGLLRRSTLSRADL